MKCRNMTILESLLKGKTELGKSEVPTSETERFCVAREGLIGPIFRVGKIKKQEDGN